MPFPLTLASPTKLSSWAAAKSSNRIAPIEVPAAHQNNATQVKPHRVVPTYVTTLRSCLRLQRILLHPGPQRGASYSNNEETCRPQPPVAGHAAVCPGLESDRSRDIRAGAGWRAGASRQVQGAGPLLHASDFQVYEEGPPQKILHFSCDALA